MKSLTVKQFLPLFLSGVFAALVISNAVFLLSWISYVPIFLLLRDKTSKQYLASGLIFGLGTAVVCFFWMLGAAKEFSGNHFLYGFLVTAFSIILFCIYWSGLFFCFGFFIQGKPNAVLRNAFLVASCFALSESLLSFLFGQMPYYLFNSGYGLLNNVYTIQWASFFGLPVLNFLAVLVNYLAASAIATEHWKKLAMPIGISLFATGAGFLVKKNAERSIVTLKPVKIAIAAENTPPLLRWDEKGGNILAQRLLTLNKSAVAVKPDIVLWSESTIPWAYQENDELLKEILKEPHAPDAIHIIGFMSSYSREKVYNSIYGINADGRVVGRYDKSLLLSFVESPILGLNMPFQDLNGFLVEKGRSVMPITTPHGKVGIAICNEIVKSEAALGMVENGAEFLLNSSNDGWFRNSYIVDLHFLYARLSAVITRKDIVLNSNNGISGHIKSSGEVVLKRKSSNFFTEMAVISPNRYDNSRVYVPILFLFVCFSVVFGCFLFGRTSQKL